MIRVAATMVFFLAFMASSGLIAFGADSTELIYGKLAKLPADQRTKQLEEGARKEGSLNFVHTWRGRFARDNVKLLQKRYPLVKVERGDIGSQDAAERFIAEEPAGRHLPDILTL